MKLKLLSTLASGVFVLAVASAMGLATHMVGRKAEANVAQARTVEVLRATATHIAELKQDHLVISTTIQSAPETIVSNDSAIPLHEAPTAQVEALVPVTIYPQPLQPTSTNVPPVTADVNADIDTQRSTGTATATTTASDTPLPFPTHADTPTPNEALAVVVTLEMIPTATFAPTLTIEPVATPQPTDAPKATAIPTPQPTETAAEFTPVPVATDAPTTEPSATATSGPMVSIIATPVQPTIEPSATEEATAAP